MGRTVPQYLMPGIGIHQNGTDNGIVDQDSGEINTLPINHSGNHLLTLFIGQEFRQRLLHGNASRQRKSLVTLECNLNICH